MADHVQDTLNELQSLGREHHCVAVGFSGGKDSRAVLDLAVRHFERVVPFFYYFVPGLKCEESQIEFAKERYGLTVLKYPGAEGIDALRVGLFCDEYPELDELPNLTRRTLYNWIKADTGATLILDGEKKADGIFRRRRMKNQARTMADVVHPIREWLKWEVLSYLKAQNIPIPDPGRGDSGSVSLMDVEILHLYHHHPSDYELLKSYFPYIETVVLRERWFGKSA
jgi:3'-phosphoadenosine 5'-phosphosulfate sulfotransferase (PAPS reductase)/FAD synthetase